MIEKQHHRNILVFHNASNYDWILLLVIHTSVLLPLLCRATPSFGDVKYYHFKSCFDLVQNRVLGIIAERGESFRAPQSLSLSLLCSCTDAYTSWLSFSLNCDQLLTHKRRQRCYKWEFKEIHFVCQRQDGCLLGHNHEERCSLKLHSNEEVFKCQFVK